VNDPEQHAAYQQELRGIALGARRGGIGVALVGALLVLVQRKGIAPVPLWLGVGVLGIGLLITLAAVSTRAAYHRARMRN
jgi:anaerobic C4-dicarboxylate transporter